MNVAVKLFARARDLAGRERVELELPAGACVRDVRRALSEAHPPLQSIAASLFIAVNNDYAGDDKPVSATDEIACFPPVSGG